jgi:hypothetical protein
MLANLVARVFYPAPTAADWSRCSTCQAPANFAGSPGGRGPWRYVPFCLDCAGEHGDWWTRRVAAEHAARRRVLGQVEEQPKTGGMAGG